MDLTKAIYEFLVATLPAVFLYFLGWAYRISFLARSGLTSQFSTGPCRTCSA